MMSSKENKYTYKCEGVKAPSIFIYASFDYEPDGHSVCKFDINSYLKEGKNQIRMKVSKVITSLLSAINQL